MGQRKWSITFRKLWNKYKKLAIYNIMGQIVNIKNFNKYSGRYSKKRHKVPEKEIGWYVYDSLIEKFPILALRNRNDDDESWPLTWKRNRNLPIAIDLVLSSLKAWQAFRPESSRKIVNRLSEELPVIILKFQNRMKQMGIKKAWEINKLNYNQFRNTIRMISYSVSEISSFKSTKTPMLGSKIMHHFFPEIFPVWDTAWIKNKALKKENFRSNYESKNFEDPVAREYGLYFEIMLDELYNTPKAEYKKIEKAYIKHSGISKNIIFWHFYDLAPIIFEVCLLGTI